MNRKLQTPVSERGDCLLRTLITAQVMMEVARLIGAAAQSESARRVEGLLWQCELRYDPHPSVVVRVREESLLEPVRIALRAPGFTVITKRDDVPEGDYLVACI